MLSCVERSYDAATLPIVVKFVLKATSNCISVSKKTIDTDVVLFSDISSRRVHIMAAPNVSSGPTTAHTAALFTRADLEISNDA
jgi:hypothetical protein